MQPNMSANDPFATLASSSVPATRIDVVTVNVRGFGHRFTGRSTSANWRVGEVHSGSSAAVQRANVVGKESGLKDRLAYWEKSNATTAAPA
jgi:hypothetical protein